MGKEQHDIGEKDKRVISVRPPVESNWGSHLCPTFLCQDRLQHFLDGEAAHEYDVQIPAGFAHGIRRTEIVIAVAAPFPTTLFMHLPATVLIGFMLKNMGAFVNDNVHQGFEIGNSNG